MECTCYLGVCQPHGRIGENKPRRALTPEHQQMLRRHNENDWPEDKTHYTRAETRLLAEAWSILAELIQ